MKVFANILAVRSIVSVLIALALLFAPLRFAATAQASAGVAMSDMDCPQKQSCCAMDKADCAKAQGCQAQCGSAPGLAVPDKALRRAVAGSEVYAAASVLLTPHFSSPLRRPPRA